MSVILVEKKRSGRLTGMSGLSNGSTSDVNGLDMDYPDIYPDIQWISRIKI